MFKHYVIYVLVALCGMMLGSWITALTHPDQTVTGKAIADLRNDISNLREAVRTIGAAQPDQPSNSADIPSTQPDVFHTIADADHKMQALPPQASAEKLAECLADIDQWSVAPGEEAAFRDRKMMLVTILRQKVKQEVEGDQRAALQADSGNHAARLHAEAGQILALYPMSQDPAVMDEAKSLSAGQADVAIRIELIRRQRYNQWACDQLAAALDGYHNASSMIHRTKAKEDESDSLVKNLGAVDPYILEPAVSELYTYTVDLTSNDLDEKEKVELARRLSDPSNQRKTLQDF